MSDYIRHLSLQLTVHPTLPALLTKTRPTEDQISYLLFKKNEFQITKDLLPIQSLRIRWNRSSPKTSNHSLYLTRLLTISAILREISEGTSYQIVRWVFRLYTQLWQAICTSALLEILHLSFLRLRPIQV